MKHLIKSVMAVTMNEDEILKNVDILIDNGIIKKIGGDLSDEYAESVIDGSGKLVMPGLINCHCHVPMTLLRNYADDMDLQTWLFQHIFPAEDRLSGEDVYWGSLLGIMEMLSSGTTCFADMYFHMDNIASAVEASGIRAQLSRGQICGDAGTDFSENIAMKESVEFIKKWHGSCEGRLSAAMAPHALYTCSPGYIKAIRDTAEKLGVPIHTHVDETKIEHEDSLRLYGKTPVRHLYDLGLFDLKTISAHCVWITEEDMELLSGKQVSIIHNPTSNLKLASGIAPIPKALSKELNVALGTDGASSNNNLNLWEEINLASIIHKGYLLEPTVVKAGEALKMATVNGARALGLSMVGSIKEGNRADLIMIDLEKPHLKPLHNVISALAYSVSGSDVCLTMVDGRILYENGRYNTIDTEKVCYNVNKIYNRLKG